MHDERIRAEKDKKKLTKFQKALHYYFIGLFEGKNERNLFSYYYILIFLFRRIFFVLTAIWLYEYP